LILLIGIVTYNSGRTILRCLESIRKALPAGCESNIVIFDNVSTDDTTKKIRDSYPQVKMIQSQENKGYAFGVNRISESMKWDYFLIVNPDVYAEESSIEEALAYVHDKPEIGVIGANILDITGKPSHSHGDLLTPRLFEYDFSGFRKIFKRENLSTFKKVTIQKKPFEAGYITGAFMIISRSAWDRIGGFDESFFLYFEDTDWAFRLKNAGLKAVVHPDVRAIHESGASFEKDLSGEYFKLKCYFTSAYTYLEKHFGRKRMLKSFRKIERFIDTKILLLKIIGMSNAESSRRQKLLRLIHLDIESEIMKTLETGDDQT
jgi:GT2 family glycosyltransferase